MDDDPIHVHLDDASDAAYQADRNVRALVAAKMTNDEMGSAILGAVFTEMAHAGPEVVVEQMLYTLAAFQRYSAAIVEGAAAVMGVTRESLLQTVAAAMETQ